MTDKSEIPQVDRDAAARRRLAEREEAEGVVDQQTAGSAKEPDSKADKAD
jgi:hypothetical protein